MINEKENQDHSENEQNMEFTRNHQDREFHNITGEGEGMMPEDLDGEVERKFEQNDSETDLYPNTVTGNRVSAMDRKENFTDENYGATGQRTLKDIIRETKSNESEKENQ